MPLQICKGTRQHPNNYLLLCPALHSAGSYTPPHITPAAFWLFLLQFALVCLCISHQMTLIFLIRKEAIVPES